MLAKLATIFSAFVFLACLCLWTGSYWHGWTCRLDAAHFVIVASGGCRIIGQHPPSRLLIPLWLPTVAAAVPMLAGGVWIATGRRNRKIQGFPVGSR